MDRGRSATGAADGTHPAGAVNCLLMLVWGPAIDAGLGGRGEALAQAVADSNVAFCGSLGVWLVNTFASVLRGAGNMGVPSATFLVVSLAQVLIGGVPGLGWGPIPSLGMPGVAAGQVIAFSDPVGRATPTTRRCTPDWPRRGCVVP